MVMGPKVFISHASEDKERFVLRFAERLRSKGIDAWVDKWEMLLGDNLVEKIFSEGLKRSDAVVVILSKFSVDKAWVQRELTTAVVKNIENKTRLIPVRLDECEIPECLRTHLYQTIQDCQSYDAEFEHIVSAIHGQYDKPPLGNPPPYATSDIFRVGDLCPNDSLFLATACKIADEQGHPVIDADSLETVLAAEGVSQADMAEAQEVLASRGFLDVLRTKGSRGVNACKVTTLGYGFFAENSIPHFSDMLADVARLLVEHVVIKADQISNREVIAELKLPSMRVEHIFERLRNSGLIKYGTELGLGLKMTVFWVSPELRRKVEQASR